MGPGNNAGWIRAEDVETGQCTISGGSHKDLVFIYTKLCLQMVKY